MKKKKYIGIWLLITLVMAIGIGTFGALYLSHSGEDTSNNDSTAQSEAAEDSSEDSASSNDGGPASPKAYLSNQRQHDIDLDILGAVMGEYQSDDWNLSILEDHGDDGPYMIVEDKESGSTAFEGKIMYLLKNPDTSKTGYLVIVEVDKDTYDKMPEDWQLESDDKYAILDINEVDEGINLGYRGSEILFIK